MAVVADGAGSATLGRYGAVLSCRVLSVRLRDFLIRSPQTPPNDKIPGWVNEVRDTISRLAKSRDVASREFAATLAGVALSQDFAVAFRIGDSAVAARDGSSWDVLCPPHNGEYASTTYFITDEPRPELEVFCSPREHDAYAVFTDGVGEIAFHSQTQTAHAGFFDPMFRPVDESPGNGKLRRLSQQLADYLASPQVCDRTDDDKTLIMISET